jgi:hypothetical protein
MRKTFLFVAAVASCAASPERMTLRFERAPQQWTTCAADGKAAALDRTITEVEAHSLVIDACADYAECGNGSEVRLQIDAPSLPDLRSILAPEQHLALRVAPPDAEGRCAWELAATSREQPPRLLLYAADGVERTQLAPVRAERLRGNALRVRVGDAKARVASGKSARLGVWRLHNAGGRAYWIMRVARE